MSANRRVIDAVKNLNRSVLSLIRLDVATPKPNRVANVATWITATNRKNAPRISGPNSRPANAIAANSRTIEPVRENTNPILDR